MKKYDYIQIFWNVCDWLFIFVVVTAPLQLYLLPISGIHPSLGQLCTLALLPAAGWCFPGNAKSKNMFSWFSVLLLLLILIQLGSLVYAVKPVNGIGSIGLLVTFFILINYGYCRYDTVIQSLHKYYPVLLILFLVQALLILIGIQTLYCRRCQAPAWLILLEEYVAA